jgi:hypothetical protein
MMKQPIESTEAHHDRSAIPPDVAFAFAGGTGNFGSSRERLARLRLQEQPQGFHVAATRHLAVLKQVFQIDYRSLSSWLAEWSDLRIVLQLSKVPHFTTLQKAAQRLAKKGGAHSCSINWVAAPARSRSRTKR